MNQDKNFAISKIWTKDLILILLVSFLGYTLIYMHAATTSLVVLHLGGNKSSIGLVAGTISISALIFRLWAGDLVDKKGKRIILMAGILVMSFASLAFNIALSIGLIIFLKLLTGIGVSTYSTAVGTIITDITPQSQLNKTFGYNALIGTAASSVGSFLGIYIFQKYNYNGFFTAAFVVGILCFMVSILINYEKNVRSR